MYVYTSTHRDEENGAESARDRERERNRKTERRTICQYSSLRRSRESCGFVGEVADWGR